MTNILVTIAGDVRAAHLDALRPLAEIAAHTTTEPPTLEAGLNAVVHLTAAQPHIDFAATELYRELIAAGVSAATLARLLAMRTKALTDRLAVSAPAGITVPEVPVGAFKLRDAMSTRAARESLVTAASDLGNTYADALRPLRIVSEGGVPEAATVDAAVEAAMHLRASRRDLQHSLDAVLAALVLGGVKRTVLSDLLGINAATLQRRLLAHPLASARGCDLVRGEDGVWRVERKPIGRYAPKKYVEVDEAMIAAVVDDVVAKASR